MTKYMFKCPKCNTVMSIETELPDRQIHKVPPCPCGFSRMVDMSSDAYKYGLPLEPEWKGKASLGKYLASKYGEPTGLWE